MDAIRAKSGSLSRRLPVVPYSPRPVMQRDSPAFDAETFFRIASWQCVHTPNATAVARTLGLMHYEPAKVPDDLVQIDPYDLPCLVVSDRDGWTWIFGHSLGLKSARSLSAEFGECVAVHLDDTTGTYRSERAKDGEVVRRVYASERDAEYDDQGEPGPGEPQVPTIQTLSGADVLGFAVAWGVDAKQLFRQHGARAFIASRKPFVNKKEDAPPRVSMLSTVLGALILLTMLGALGAGAWWVVRSDHGTAAAQFCEQQLNCSGCVSCAASPPHACAETFHACEENESCFELNRCLAKCQDLGARTGFKAPSDDSEPCFAACRAEHAEGLEDYCAWTDCSYRDACSELCTDPGYQRLSACE